MEVVEEAEGGGILSLIMVTPLHKLKLTLVCLSISRMFVVRCVLYTYTPMSNFLFGLKM